MSSVTRLSRLLVFACLTTVSVETQAADPFVGTGMRNVATSNAAFKSGATIAALRPPFANLE